MKLLKLLTIIVLIIFPFGELLRFDIGNNIVLKPLDFFVGVAVIWWIILRTQNIKLKTQNYDSKLKVFLVFFILIGLLSLLINLSWLKSSEFFVSSLYLIRWSAYASIFFVVIQFDEKFKKIIKHLLFIDGLIILLIGFLQYFFYNSLKNLYYLGWDEHLHRMFSVFFDPNFASAFFVLFFILTAGLFINHLKTGKKKTIIIIIFLLLTILTAVFLTFSRSGILMLIVGVIVFLTLIGRKKLIFIILAAILLFGILASPKFYDENMNLLREASGKARLANYALAWRIFRDRPLLGVGFNSYRYTKNLYGLDYGWVNAPSHADAGVDNSLLFVLATTGMIGGLGYLGIWIAILKRAFKIYKKNKNMIAIVVISSSTGLFVNALFINSLFFAPLMLWMWILIGLMWND